VVGVAVVAVVVAVDGGEVVEGEAEKMLLLNKAAAEADVIGTGMAVAAAMAAATADGMEEVDRDSRRRVFGRYGVEVDSEEEAGWVEGEEEASVG